MAMAAALAAAEAELRALQEARQRQHQQLSCGHNNSLPGHDPAGGHQQQQPAPGYGDNFIPVVVGLQSHPSLGMMYLPDDGSGIVDSHHHNLMQLMETSDMSSGISLGGETMGSTNHHENEMLQELMRLSQNGNEAANQFFQQLLAQQQEEQEQQQGSLDQQYQQQQHESYIPSQPQHHYLTMAHNGTILEATQTVTGFPPESLLMTSAYDHLHDEDLPGFLCVKTQFWDRGQGNVPVFLRRRSIDGEYMWLESQVVQYLSEPITGVILEERLVTDEYRALRFNRITRITAVLVQAVEAARLTEHASHHVSNTDDTDAESSAAAGAAPAGIGSGPSSIRVPGTATTSLAATLNDDTAHLQNLMENMAASGGVMPDNLQNLMQIASSSHSVKDETENMVQAEHKKSSDPFSMMDAVRKGVRLDLGLTRLQTAEIRMIALVLSGKIQADDVAPLVVSAFLAGQTLRDAFAPFRLELDRSPSSRHATESRLPLDVAVATSSVNARASSVSPIHFEMPNPSPPPISVVNLSYTYIGNQGIEMVGEILCTEGSVLKTLDVSFCNIEEKGFLSLARSFVKRKRRRIPQLRGIILSGNYLSPRAAEQIGAALSPPDRESGNSRRRRKRSRPMNAIGRTGYDSDSNESEDDEEDDDYFNLTGKSSSARSKESRKSKCPCDKENGLQLLHVANASLSAAATGRLLDGLGPHCSVRELNLSSNNFGPKGASTLATFLEGKRAKEHVPMPFLDRLDMSNNHLGDDGTTQLTRAISRRSSVHLVDLKLSSNSIQASGIETIMNKLLQHNLVSLSLDKNAIGDQGCQLVAASLQSMKSLTRLNLSFNQIGSRGVNSLMRSLIGCESIIYLGLSGNILRISGAIALAFTLAQHPRLEELDLDNCCLGQAAQCHITAGIISNRWVPMKRLKGYLVAPPMVAIGALDHYNQSLSNEECFRIRKDEQMKTILQWMESNRMAKKMGTNRVPSHIAGVIDTDSANQQFLTADFVSSINDVHGTPSQNAYFRLLGWLSRIPFDDDELTALQKYFYDADGGDGDRGEDGLINLKLRGDILGALDSEVADDIRDQLPYLDAGWTGSVGIDLNKLFQDGNAWETFTGKVLDDAPVIEAFKPVIEEQQYENSASSLSSAMPNQETDSANKGMAHAKHSSLSAALIHSESATSNSGKGPGKAKMKPRITMFPQFEQQLEELKATATDMIEQEEDPMQHDVILTQYAEASLTILRQLRYHCMNSGLDGWRQGGLKRKVLVVDDSTVTRKLISRHFEKANFIVDTASNGEQGVEKLKASIYDIAFMDIDMPVMNGFEATKKLREWEDKMRPGCRQPICALTAAYVDDFERSELMKFKEAGLDVMESKPCNIPRLFKVVDDVSPMFSDLSISVIQRERSDTLLSDMLGNHARHSSDHSMSQGGPNAIV